MEVSRGQEAAAKSFTQDGSVRNWLPYSPARRTCHCRSKRNTGSTHAGRMHVCGKGMPSQRRRTARLSALTLLPEAWMELPAASNRSHLATSSLQQLAANKSCFQRPCGLDVSSWVGQRRWQGALRREGQNFAVAASACDKRPRAQREKGRRNEKSLHRCRLPLLSSPLLKPWGQPRLSCLQPSWAPHRQQQPP